MKVAVEGSSLFIFTDHGLRRLAARLRNADRGEVS